MRAGGLKGSRSALLLCGAALSLHELRYLLAFGSGSARALEQQGHGYLDLLSPLIVLVLAGVLAHFARQLAGPRGEASGAIGWRTASAALLAIYCTQETVEGLLATGHPTGLAALSASGGLLAVPLAVLLGAVVALLAREASNARSSPSSVVAPSLSPAPPRPTITSIRALILVLRMMLMGCGARGPPCRLH